MVGQVRVEQKNAGSRVIASGVLITTIVLLSALFMHAAKTLGGSDSKAALNNLFRGGEFLDKSGVVLQEASNDCGAAALKMVFDHYRIVRPLEDWTGDLIDRPEGTSMLRLKEVSERWGLRAEGWRISSQDIETIPLPSIALMNRNHYVVIESIQDTGDLIYADPSFGRLKMKTIQFLSRTKGEMLLIWKE